VRIATMIISLILMLVVGGPVVLIGGAFALAFPFVSVLAFFFAGIIGLAGGASTSFGDLTIWGVVSLILTVLSYFGWREKRKRRREEATRVVCQPIHLSAWNGDSPKFTAQKNGRLADVPQPHARYVTSVTLRGGGLTPFFLRP
jgi:hypothetical protein